MNAFVRGEFGEETDITEGVRALYDLVLGSMNWGSGFWTVEDATPVSVIAHAMGFADAEKVDAYIADRTHEAEAEEWPDRPPRYSSSTTPHEHVLSSVGRCMWPYCRIGREG